MDTKARWRRIQKLVKHEVSINLAKLELIELYDNVGFGSCEYREDVINKSLMQSFEILNRSVPKRLLLDKQFNTWENNPEFYGMQERLEMWFEQVIPAENYDKAYNYSLTKGYITDGKGVTKCFHCQSKEITMRDTYYDERGVIEGVIYCKKCTKDLCSWYYGNIELLDFLDDLIELKGWEK